MEKVVFKPVLPANMHMFIDVEAAVCEVSGALAATMLGPVAKTLVQAEEAYINNWDHKPKIVSGFTHQKTQLKLVVTPKGTNKRYWAFVSLGTKPHPITSSERMPMREYVPHTFAMGAYNGPGVHTGVVYAYTSAVEKQQIKPRKFEEHIVDKFERNIQLLMIYAVEKALREYRV